MEIILLPGVEVQKDKRRLTRSLSAGLATGMFSLLPPSIAQCIVKSPASLVRRTEKSRG